VKHHSNTNSTDASGEHRHALHHINPRIVELTLFNALVYWPWAWLRNAFERGIHHSDLVLLLTAVTLWGWWQLLDAIAHEVRLRIRH
jgi:hypothetical protein